MPGESVTEEQFTDEEGNLITRKVIILGILCFSWNLDFLLFVCCSAPS